MALNGRGKVFRVETSMRMLALGLLAVSALPLSVHAQSYPTKPVQFVVGVPPGGATDTFGRAIADGLGKLWNQSTVVENKPGANTIIAAQYVKNAAPDGHTIWVAGDAGLTINPYIYSKLPYDPTKDFVLATRLLRAHQLLVVPTSLPVNNLKEFVELMKKDGAKYNFGSVGIGDPNHICFSWFQKVGGFEVVHVPYKGLAASLQAMLSGDVHVMIASELAAGPYLKTGKLKALAISGPVRSKTLPDVPTVAEAGYPDAVFQNFFALALPAGTPKNVLDKIAADANTVMNDPAFKAKFIDPFGYQILLDTPEQAAAAYKTELANAEKMVKASGAKLDY